MENKLATTALKGYFIAVAVLMYYFITQTINLGLFVTYRHAFALLLFASAFFDFNTLIHFCRITKKLSCESF